MKIMINIDENDLLDIKDYGLFDIPMNRHLVDIVTKVIKNGTPISNNATNGDVIKAMFPDIQWDNECNGIIYGFKEDDRGLPIFGVDLDWWNSPYKKEEKE